MAMVVKNNMSAVRTLNTLNNNSAALQKSLAKVSSGMKINSAQDDASGYAISERMRVQIRSLDQANQNTQNASSLMKTAEGAVSSTLDILKSLKEKAINAATDTNTDSDRATIQKEIDQFIDQIDDNALTTFNGKYLVDGSKNNAHMNTRSAFTNQNLAESTTGLTKLAAGVDTTSDDTAKGLSNRLGESLEIASTDYVTASFVKDGKTYTTTYQVSNTSVEDIFDKMNAEYQAETATQDVVFGGDLQSGGSGGTSSAGLVAQLDDSQLADIIANGENSTVITGQADGGAELLAALKDLAGGTTTSDAVDTAKAAFAAELTGIAAADQISGASSQNNFSFNTKADGSASFSQNVSNGSKLDFSADGTNAGTSIAAEAADAVAAIAAEYDGSTTDGADAAQFAITKMSVSYGNNLNDTNATKAVFSVDNEKFHDLARAALVDAAVSKFVTKTVDMTALTDGETITADNKENYLLSDTQRDNYATNAGITFSDATDSETSLKEIAAKLSTETGATSLAAETDVVDALTHITTDLANATIASSLGADKVDSIKHLVDHFKAGSIADDSTSGSSQTAGPAHAENTDAPTYLVTDDTKIGTNKSGDDVNTADGTKGLTVTSATAGVAGQISGVTISISDSDGNVKKAANAALDGFSMSIRAENRTTAVDANNNLTFQVGANANQAISVSLTDMRSEALGLKGSDGSKVSVATQDKANAAVAVFDNAIQKVLDQQATIGAIESRLDYTSSNLTTSSENVQAAESTIRDADMAKEMTNYTKNNVLLQAAQSMLAQANQNSSAVLSLLQ